MKDQEMHQCRKETGWDDGEVNRFPESLLTVLPTRCWWHLPELWKHFLNIWCACVCDLKRTDGFEWFLAWICLPEKKKKWWNGRKHRTVVLIRADSCSGGRARSAVSVLSWFFFSFFFFYETCSCEERKREGREGRGRVRLHVHYKESSFCCGSAVSSH